MKTNGNGPGSPVDYNPVEKYDRTVRVFLVNLKRKLTTALNATLDPRLT